MSEKDTEMPYEIIKDSEAPRPPAKLSKSSNEMAEMIEALKKGGVAKIAVPTGKTARGIKTGLGRSASTIGEEVQSWDVGDGFVYVKYVGKKKSK